MDCILPASIECMIFVLGDGKTYPVENNNAKQSKVKRNSIIAIAAAITVILCFLICIGLYYRYYKKNKRLQMKFDTEYELAAKR